VGILPQKVIVAGLMRVRLAVLLEVVVVRD
jgi:hypothetical protein